MGTSLLQPNWAPQHHINSKLTSSTFCLFPHHPQFTPLLRIFSLLSSPALFSLIQFISFFSPWQQIIIRFFFPSILKSKIHSFNSLDCKYTVCMQHNSTKNLLPTLHTPNFLSIFNRRGSELRLSVYICKLTSSSFVYMKNYSATKKPSRERNRG